MEVFEQAMYRAQELRALVMGLLFAASLVAAWFPGHNAARWGHPAAAVVSRAGWMWCMVAVALSMSGLIEQAWPVLLGAWVMLAVWSYGKAARPLSARARMGRGFEVLRNQDEAALNSIPTAAVAS